MSSHSPQLPPSPPAQEQHEPIGRPLLYLLYHELSAAKNEYSYSLSVGSFREHLTTMQQIRAGGGTALWPAITFDDGHVSNFVHALPLLSSLGMQAHFFITAGWTGTRPEFMTWEQLRQVQAAGQFIGAHGWSHTLLTHCSDEELRHELEDARHLLEDKLKVPITTMSLPGGRYDRRVLEACRRAGYTQVFTSIPRAECSADANLVGRLNIRAEASGAWLSKLLTDGSVLQRLAWQYRLKNTAKQALGDALYAKLWARLNRADPEAHLA